MRSQLRILHLEPDPTCSDLVREALQGDGFDCHLTRVDTRPQFDASLEQGGFDLILADNAIPSFDGLSALRLATQRCPEIPFVFLSGTLDEEVAIESLKLGATDYVFKAKLSRLAPSVRRALSETEQRAGRAQAEGMPAAEGLRAREAELAQVGRLMTMREMAASIAHDVNQPLSAVVLNGKACLRWLAGDRPDLEEARGAVERIVEDAKRAGEIIARVRALARRAPSEKLSLDLEESIEQVLLLARGELLKNGVILRTSHPAALPPAVADLNELQQVLLNLVLNAVEAMNTVTGRPRDLVVSTAEHDPGHLVVAVQDAGVGLDRATGKRIFDAFFTTKPGHMGMGLSICRSIVEDHQGRLWASPNEGPGTTFRFTLPIAGQDVA